MKLKNTGNKHISIAGICILPGEVKEVSDAFSSNSVVCMMERIGNLEAVGERTEQIAPSDSSVSPEPPPAKPISRISKAELAEECENLGIEVSEDDTRETLIEKIRGKTTE